MDALIPFLKHSSVLDLLIIIVVILLVVILSVVGIWIMIASRTRKPIYFFLLIALFPLLLALLGTYLRIGSYERALTMFPEASAEVVESARQEAWVTTYIGMAGTAILGLIGVTGLVLKDEESLSFSRSDSTGVEIMIAERSSSPLYDRAEHAAQTIRARSTTEARLAIVLGSGLGGFAEEFQESVRIPYNEIPGFVSSTAEGHVGSLVIGKVEGVPVIAMQGRVHYYEGYTLEEVTFPIRTFKLLGIKTLILTNAAGGIDVQLKQGALMVISDHLNLMGVNPLRGPNDERFGLRFPDMSQVYARQLQELVSREAKALKITVRRGIYAALAGPCYETPAEIHMLRATGADAVGMSTVPEAIVARHMGLKVLGISCITNMAAGISESPINHEEVMETGQMVRETFTQLLRRVIAKVPE